MIQGLKVFVSKHDIASGSRWGNEIAAELADTSFGILCLTRTNQTAPWLLFEAGALTKLPEGRACGLLLDGLTAANVAGPLAHFQHREITEEDFAQLARDLNKQMQSPLDADTLDTSFSQYWPKIDSDYREILRTKPQLGPDGGGRSDRELLEEIVVRLRAIDHEPERSAAPLPPAPFEDLPLEAPDIEYLLWVREHGTPGHDDPLTLPPRERVDARRRLLRRGFLALGYDRSVRVSPMGKRWLSRFEGQANPDSEPKS